MVYPKSTRRFIFFDVPMMEITRFTRVKLWIEQQQADKDRWSELACSIDEIALTLDDTKRSMYADDKRQ
jgi:hypothetical protein